MSGQRYYVYILTNKNNNVMYVGITNNLNRRLYEHQNELIDGFTKRYHVHKLVYFEEFGLIDQAIVREKEIKSLSRAEKDRLIDTINPDRKDLFEQ